MSSTIAELRALANDIEAGERGFLLTGDERHLVPIDQANASFPTHSDAAKRYSKDEAPAIQKLVAEVLGLVRTRLDQANDAIKTQQEQGFASAVNLIRSNGSEDTMNALRKAISDLQIRVGRQQTGYLDEQRKLTRWRFLFFAGGTLVMIGVMIWLYNDMLSYLDERDSAHVKLQTLNTELETRIGERTLDLTQANEELQQFAYVASHDLQEPLRTITSFTQLLATRYKGRLDEDADEFIGYIVTSSRRMTDLINGLLAVARLRRAGQPTAPVSFAKLLDEAEISLQAAIRESKAEIHRGELPSLVVDKVQFSQVLQNLISNAIKYRRDEPPIISIKASRDVSNWVFSITDNGRGFNQQFAERIFGLFQRLHIGDIDGTGMGLSISRKIVERHGGRIWAESTEGQGSTFYFSLPTSLEFIRHPQSEEARQAVAEVDQ